MVAQRTNTLNSTELVSSTLLSGSNSISKASETTSFNNLLTKSSNRSNLNDAGVKNLGSKETNGKQETLVSHKNSLDTNKKQITQNSVNKVKNDNASTDVNEKASKLVKDVKDVVEEMLGITEEELTSIMEVLGLTMIDLLQPASLQQLVLASSGNDDPMLMLTDETLSNTFKELMSTITELLEESNFSLEELKESIGSDEFIKFLQHGDAEKQDYQATVGNEEGVTIPMEKQKEPSKIELAASMETVEETDSEAISEAQKTIDFSVTQSVDSENDGNLSENDKQATNKETPTIDNFIDYVVSSITTTETDFSGELSKITTIREIASQIVEQIKVVIRSNQTSMELQLNPEHLGKVALSITSKEGVMTALFTTQTEMAKEAIENQLHILRQNLESQGIKVEVVEVTVAEFSFGQSNEAENGQEFSSGKGKRPFRMELESDVELAEASSVLPSGLVDETVSSIDYSA